MIDPKDFISSKSYEPDPDIIETDGTFSCPEQGCYEVVKSGQMNIRTRTVTWTCPNGHDGKAML